MLQSLFFLFVEYIDTWIFITPKDFCGLVLIPKWHNLLTKIIVLCARSSHEPGIKVDLFYDVSKSQQYWLRFKQKILLAVNNMKLVYGSLILFMNTAKI